MDRMRLKRSRLTIQLDVHVMLDGEWPQPVVTMRRRHARARSIAFSTSSRVSGWMYSSGMDEKVRAHVWWTWFSTARKGTLLLVPAGVASSAITSGCIGRRVYQYL